MRKLIFLLLFLLCLSIGAEKMNKGLIIVTTDSIVKKSEILADFIKEKECRGFTVKVATEADYDTEGVKGQKRAEKIREWLKKNSKGSSYLLLIGDAHPDYGDVPMWKVWPRHTYSSTECLGFAFDCRSCETDAMYSNLESNWDLNQNGKYGEHTLDQGEGGIIFEPALATGRISVFFNNTDELDIILQNAIDYGNQTKEQITYRKKVLLPASFFYFKGQKMTTYTWPYNVDGAESANWLHHNYLSTDDVTVTTMYEKEGFITSEFESDIPLTNENLMSEWEKNYGIIMWFGHGLPKTVARTVWDDDTNSDGNAQSTEMSHPLLIDSDSVLSGTFTKPGFVVASSCEVGSVEVPENLTHSMLLKNAAVGVLASTNLTPGDATDYSDIENELDTETFGSSNSGIFMIKGLLEGKSAALAYSDSRHSLGTGNSIETLAGKMMMNYYGDPTLTLYDTVEDRTEPVETDTGNDSSDSSLGCSLTII